MLRNGKVCSSSSRKLSMRDDHVSHSLSTPSQRMKNERWIEIQYFRCIKKKLFFFFRKNKEFLSVETFLNSFTFFRVGKLCWIRYVHTRLGSEMTSKTHHDTKANEKDKKKNARHSFIKESFGKGEKSIQ